MFIHRERVKDSELKNRIIRKITKLREEEYEKHGYFIKRAYTDEEIGKDFMLYDDGELYEVEIEDILWPYYNHEIILPEMDEETKKAFWSKLEHLSDK